jgi:hypothetical protein
VSDERAGALVADCANCAGLCCVALAFTRSNDFAFDKDAGEECRNLTDDYRCGVHSTLRDDGFKGCTVFDCHGAGQKVTRTIFAGSSWRPSTDMSYAMFAVFRVVRQLHEMLWYLSNASKLSPDPELAGQASATYELVNELSEGSGNEVLALDLEKLRMTVNGVLTKVSSNIRSIVLADRVTPLPKKLKPGADLIGISLPGENLRGADLRGSLLLAADMSGSDLRDCDLLAADLRDAQLDGADLSTALFVTQMQVNAARGNLTTKLPIGTVRPSHWI